MNKARAGISILGRGSDFSCIVMLERCSYRLLVRDDDNNNNNNNNNDK